MSSGSHTGRSQIKGSVSIKGKRYKIVIYLFLEILFIYCEKKVMQYNKNAWIYDGCYTNNFKYVSAL